MAMSQHRPEGFARSRPGAGRIAILLGVVVGAGLAAMPAAQADTVVGCDTAALITALGQVTITTGRISDNRADGGGAIAAGPTLTIANSTISGNGANFAGGGILAGSGTLTISNSTISGNTASQSGGGIFDPGPPT